jgi:predicted XRE-type DNA-binding protein
MQNIPHEASSDNVFATLGFAPAEAAELTVKGVPIATIGDTILERALTQAEAAALCGANQPTLSKVLRGRMESVTIDRLKSCLHTLGRSAPA